jgi:hypothetical protein
VLATPAGWRPSPPIQAGRMVEESQSGKIRLQNLARALQRHSGLRLNKFA